jgi:catechol 2,3-dioxygenase-like lactoylglutathione lyase family enzyme
MKIILTSVFVNDQGKALHFYTDVLGFVKKQDITAGDYRWLTVVSPDQPDGTELLLEPNDNPAAKTYQLGDFRAGHPRNDVRGREHSKGIPAFKSTRCRLYRRTDAGYGLRHEGVVQRHLRQSHPDRPEIKKIITSSVSASRGSDLFGNPHAPAGDRQEESQPVGVFFKKKGFQMGVLVDPSSKYFRAVGLNLFTSW